MVEIDFFITKVVLPSFLINGPSIAFHIATVFNGDENNRSLTVSKRFSYEAEAKVDLKLGLTWHR